MYCKNCGTKMTEGSNYCPNCGAPLGQVFHGERREKPFWRYGWFTVLMLFVCFPVGVILIFMNHGKVVKWVTGVLLAIFIFMTLSAVFTTTGDYLSVNDVKRYIGMNVAEDNRVVSTTQLEFGKRLKEFKDSYNRANTKLQKSEVHNQQIKYLREFFNKNEMQGWKGEVFLIEPVEGGNFASVHLKCSLGGINYYVLTEKYASILSDNQTLISKGTELYEKIKDLKNYDDVIFSAKVVSNKNRFYNRDTLLGATDVWNPEFVVEFTDIKKVDSY